MHETLFLFPVKIWELILWARHFRTGETMTKIITDWDIQAYLDNELPWEEQKAVIKALEGDSDLRQLYNDYRRQKALLQEWWRDH